MVCPIIYYKIYSSIHAYSRSHIKIYIPFFFKSIKIQIYTKSMCLREEKRNIKNDYRPPTYRIIDVWKKSLHNYNIRVEELIKVSELNK